MEEKLNQALQDHNKFIKADSWIDAINEKFDQLKDRFDSLNHSLAIIRFLFYAICRYLEHESPSLASEDEVIRMRDFVI